MLICNTIHSDKNFTMKKSLFFIITNLLLFSAYAEFGSGDSDNLRSLKLSSDSIADDTALIETYVYHIEGWVDDVERLLTIISTNGNVSASLLPVLNDIKQNGIVIHNDLNALSTIESSVEENTLTGHGIAQSATNVVNTVTSLNTAFQRFYNNNSDSWSETVKYDLDQLRSLVLEIKDYTDQLGFLQNIDTSLNTIKSDISNTGRIRDDVNDIASDANKLLLALYGSDNTLNHATDNVIKYVRQIASQTNDLSIIERDLANTTNILGVILHTIQTNRLDNISITNLVDYTQYLEDISDDVKSIQTQFEEFSNGYHDSLSDFVTDPITNSVNGVRDTLSVIGGQTTNLLASIDLSSAISTNIQLRIANRLDNWDNYYQIFTNKYNNASWSWQQYKQAITQSSGTIINTSPKFNPKSVNLIEGILDYFNWINEGLFSLNNYQYLHHYQDITNNTFLSSIDDSLTRTTNILSTILYSIQTNRFDNISISNFVDYTDYLEDIRDDLQMLQTQFEEFINGLNDNFTDFITDPITNSVFAVRDTLNDIGGQSTNILRSIDISAQTSTNLQQRIAKRLDGWDFFYHSFTNLQQVPVWGNNKYYTRLSLMRDNNYNPMIERVTWTPQNRSFIDAVRYGLSNIAWAEFSVNNYLNTFSYFFETNNNHLATIDDSLTILNDDGLRYFLNPNTYYSSSFNMPQYRYKGFSSPITVSNQQINPDLSGLQYTLFNFVPNNLASINNYLYDYYQNGIKLRDFDLSELQITNIVNVSLTNNVDTSWTNILVSGFASVNTNLITINGHIVSFTNTLKNIDNNISNFVSVVLSLDMDSPLHGYVGDDDIYDYLTNYYFTVSTGNASSSQKTNWFNRVEMLLGALVYGGSNSQGTNLVSNSTHDDVKQDYDSITQDLTSQEGLQSQLYTLQQSQLSVMQMFSDIGTIFDGMSPTSDGITITINNPNNTRSSNGDIIFHNSVDEKSNTFFEFVRHLTTLAWTILYILLLIVYIRMVIRFAVNVIGLAWLLVSFNKGG